MNFGALAARLLTTDTRPSSPIGPIRNSVGSAFLAGYPLVFAAPRFRSLFVVLLLAGTASGMAMAYVAVWASTDFHIGPQAVSMLFVVSGLTGAIGNPLIGIVSDRYGRRRGLIVGQLAITALAYIGYTQAASYSVAIALVAFSGFGVMGLVLAIVNDLIRALPRDEQRNAARILAAERTGWSIGIIIGPAVAAAIVASSGGTHLVFVAAAITQLVAGTVALTATAGERHAAGTNRPAFSGTGAGAGPAVTIPTMLVLIVALVLVTLPSQTRTMFLPLFVTDVLGEPPGIVGPLFTLNAFVAVMTMPHVGGLADRIGAQRVLYIGAVTGAIYCVLQSQAGDYTQTLLIQMLIGFSIALWSTASLIFLQQLLPGRAGMAGGLYVAVQQLTPVLSGLVLGPIAETTGIPAAFSATAGLCLTALVLLLLASRALRTARN